MILVDTSVWVDLLRGQNSPEQRKLVELIESEEEISLTGIILTEILQGIKEDSQRLAAQDYLLAFAVFEPQSLITYINAARIYNACRRNGRTVRSTVDCIIAAVCLENNFTILHKDRDYDVIRECTGLKALEI